MEIKWRYYRVIFLMVVHDKKGRYHHTFSVSNTGKERAERFARGRDLIAVVIEGTEETSRREVWAEVDHKTFAIGTIQYSNPYPGDAG